MKNRPLLIGTFIVIAVVTLAIVTFPSSSLRLRGDLGATGGEGRVIVCADIVPTDGVLTVREMRKFLLKLFRDVITQNAGCDPNGDGVTSKPDVAVAITIVRSFLTAECGDGTRGIIEYCDDGNVAGTDGCSALCTVEDNYTCDTATPNKCYTFPECGNGVTEPGIPDADQPDGMLWDEQCDDGATCEGGSRDGQHCTTNASAEDALGCPGDDAHCVTQSFDGCSKNTCLPEICGNGDFEPRGLDGVSGTGDDEQCDAGGTCEFPLGHEPQNGYTYSCDFGTEADKCRHDGGTCQAVSRNGCSNTCTLLVTVCGNGVIDGSEVCDDANATNGDGCSSACVVESHFRCTGAPSSCQSYLDFVKALADTDMDGTVSDIESLTLTFDLVGAPEQPYEAKFDIDQDTAVTDADVTLILEQLDVLSPQ